MATWFEQFGNWNTKATAGLMGGGFGKGLGSLGINSSNIGGIANTIGQIGTGLLAGQNQTGIGNAMQTIGGLASNIPGVGGLIDAGVGVFGGLVNAAFGSNINDEFVAQTENQANQIGNRIFGSNTNADLLNDWQSVVMQSNVSKSEVGSDGWFSNKASDKTRELNRQIEEANRRQLANFNVAAQNVDASNDLRILQNMAAYGGPINSFRKFYDKGGYLSQAKALIRRNEGWREKPYNDAPKGKNWRSVGYGFNDSGFRDKYPEGISKHYEHGITKKQAEEELDYFLNKAEKQLKSIYGKQWNDFTDSQKAAILDTYYQRPASVGKESRFYKAVTAGEDAGKYLGVAGFDKRNKIRQGVFGGSQDYVNLGAETENPSANSSSLQEVTSFTPVVQDLDLSSITPTEAKALELNLASPTFDLSMFGKPITAPIQQAVPTVGTVEDFLASYGDFEENLFKDGGKLNIKDMNIYDFGGGLTHGADWSTGVDYVAEGQSHEQNPYGGVMVGQDEEGTPNLVEEGEYIWNGDHVFSRRMKVPKKLREKYSLPDDATFADAVAKLTKNSDERPLSPIDRNTQDYILGEFADTQEEMRMAKAQRAMDRQQQLQDDFLMGMQFGLGGILFSDGGGLSRDKDYGSKDKPYPNISKGDFAGGGRSYPIPTKADAVDALRLAGLHGRSDVKAKVYAKYPELKKAFGGSLFENPFAYGGELGNIFEGTGNKPNSLSIPSTPKDPLRMLWEKIGGAKYTDMANAAVDKFMEDNLYSHIDDIMGSIAKMSEPQLDKFFSTPVGQHVASFIANSESTGNNVQQAGVQRWMKATGRLTRPIQRTVVNAAKRAMAQSRQVARGQIRTPKGGGSQKVLNETMTPTQAARQATTGSTEGLPQGWNFTRGNTPTMTTESIVQGPNVRGARFSGRTAQTNRVNSKSTTGRAATSRGTAQDPFAGLEGTLNMSTPIGSGNFGYLPWAAGIGAGGYGLYKGIDWLADNLTNPNGTITGVNDPATQAAINSLPSEATSNKGTNRGGKSIVSTTPVSAIEEKLTKSGKKSPSSSNKTVTNSSRRSTVEMPPLNTETKNLTDIFGSAPAIDNSLPEQGMVIFDPKIMGNPDAMAKGTRTTTTDESGTKVTRVTSDGTGLERSPFKPKQTWTRYAPLVMSGLMGLKEMLTPADYGNADSIMEAAYQIGSPVSIGTEYLGDYRKRDPFDERYLMNIINQRGAATNRNMMNLSGGNRAAAMAGILSNDLTTQMSLAEAARQSYLANRADDAQVAEFNRGTNQFNATVQNQRNQFLAGLNSQRQQAMLSGISQGARLRQAIKDQRDAAIYGNLSNFAQGLGDIGWENSQYNMIGSLADEDVLKYIFDKDFITTYKNRLNKKNIGEG